MEVNYLQSNDGGEDGPDNDLVEYCYSLYNRLIYSHVNPGLPSIHSLHYSSSIRRLKSITSSKWIFPELITEATLKYHFSNLEQEDDQFVPQSVERLIYALWSDTLLTFLTIQKNNIPMFCTIFYYCTAKWKMGWILHPFSSIVFSKLDFYKKQTMAVAFFTMFQVFISQYSCCSSDKCFVWEWV